MWRFWAKKVGSRPSAMAPAETDPKAPSWHLVGVTVFCALAFFVGNSLQTFSSVGSSNTGSDAVLLAQANAANSPAPAGNGAAQANNVQAQPAQDENQQNTEPTNNLCQTNIKKLSDDDLKNFRDFLETNFENKSSTGSLLDNAIEKYRDLRRGLMDEYAKYYPNQGSSLLVTAYEPGACLHIVQDTLSSARTLLKVHAAHTSGVKKSAALIEKYQSVNHQLADMSREFMTTKALLDAFSQKLPCYVKKGECLKN